MFFPWGLPWGIPSCRGALLPSVRRSWRSSLHLLFLHLLLGLEHCIGSASCWDSLLLPSFWLTPCRGLRGSPFLAPDSEPVPVWLYRGSYTVLSTLSAFSTPIFHPPLFLVSCCTNSTTPLPSLRGLFKGPGLCSLVTTCK